ncbi:MAG: HAMP domain-containing sensor histidine kinase [Eubacteriales bacterium]|nr:HAMP domain-containing sensor histidine kinase [Eubacteriales bacterium]
MATKWKNFTRSSWVKAAAWLLALLMAGLAAWQAVTFAIYVTENDISMIDEDMLFHKEMTETYLAGELYYPAVDLLYRASYGNEEAIKNGDTIDENELLISIYEEYFNVFYDSITEETAISNEEAQNYRTRYPAKEDSTNYLTDDLLDELVTQAQRDNLIQDSGDSANFRSWLGYNRGVYQYFRQQLIQEELNLFKEFTEDGNSYNTFDYYVSCKESNTTLCNMTDAETAVDTLLGKSSNYQMVCSISDNQVKFLGNTIDSTVLSSLGNEYTDYFSRSGYINRSSSDSVYIAMKPQILQNMQTEWTENRHPLIMLLAIECTAGIIFLLCMTILCFGAGRRQDDDKVYLVWYDRIWAEILYILFFCVLGAWCAAIVGTDNTWIYMIDSVKYALICGTTVLFAASSLLLLLSRVRRIKAKQWLNSWICWRLMRNLFQKYIIPGSKRVWNRFLWLYRQLRKTPLRRKIILLSIGIPFLLVFVYLSAMFLFWEHVMALTLCFILLIVLGAAAICWGIRAADRFETITSSAADIRAGKTDTKIKLIGGGPEINGLADNLNQISEGLQDAVTTAVKSERLKSELISNVSHDIKTPLTSIITYIDLLKKCNIPDVTAQEYLTVLDQKAQRLRTLTIDLFDASKATSGAMKLDLAQTDFDALLRQALGERSEHIEKAGLDIRIRSNPPMYVYADGRLLWRILDNLISNCTRYAMPNSRVYITMEAAGAFVTLTMKNISAAELNISAEELMQRFTRGDRSRHTEGSGLGLSIAQSLADLMGGSCYVEIDGDLFKAVVSIPKWTDSISNEKP